MPYLDLRRLSGALVVIAGFAAVAFAFFGRKFIHHHAPNSSWLAASIPAATFVGLLVGMIVVIATMWHEWHSSDGPVLAGLIATALCGVVLGIVCWVVYACMAQNPGGVYSAADPGNTPLYAGPVALAIGIAAVASLFGGLIGIIVLKVPETTRRR